MLFREYDGTYQIGDVVWVCDYRYNDIDNKPIRHVRPTRVQVVSNDDLPKNKRVYYSDIHFRPIGKDGNVKSQIIAPYDNTGYRAYTGVSLNVFLSESECVAHYRKQCEDIITRYEAAKTDKVRYYDRMIADVRQEIGKVDEE